MSTYGSFGAFFTRPISAVVLAITVLILVYTGWKNYRKKKSAGTH